MSYWNPTEFGTAEWLMGSEPGTFFSHSYTDEGKQDVVNAATDHIENIVSDDTTKRIALKLLEMEGAETDSYSHGIYYRWVIYTGDIIERAVQIRKVV